MIFESAGNVSRFGLTPLARSKFRPPENDSTELDVNRLWFLDTARCRSLKLS